MGRCLYLLMGSPQKKRHSERPGIFILTFLQRQKNTFLLIHAWSSGEMSFSVSPCFAALVWTTKGIGINPHGEWREAWHMGKWEAQSHGTATSEQKSPWWFQWFGFWKNHLGIFLEGKSWPTSLYFPSFFVISEVSHFPLCDKQKTPSSWWGRSFAVRRTFHFWQPKSVCLTHNLYFWRSTPQNKCLFQAKAKGPLVYGCSILLLHYSMGTKHPPKLNSQFFPWKVTRTPKGQNRLPSILFSGVSCAVDSLNPSLIPQSLRILAEMRSENKPLWLSNILY